MDRFTTWMVDELGEVGLDPVTAESATEHVLESPDVSSALSGLLFEVVEAAASSDPDGATVDAAAVFAPAVPGITARLARGRSPRSTRSRCRRLWPISTRSSSVNLKS